MIRPRLEACYFSGQDNVGKWDRLARVLHASARQHCPAWHVRIERLDPPVVPADANGRTFTCNSHKLDYWRDVVLEAEDGDRILLIDADTLILKPIEDVWADDFDLAYTTKAIPKDKRRPLHNVDRFPLNGGVVFVRVNLRTKAFLTEWASENRLMLEDKDRHQPWLYRYGGINQASFGKLLKTGAAEDLQLRTLPCEEWNCEDSTWSAFSGRTRIVHVKGDLRKACLYHAPLSRALCVEMPALDPLRTLWQAVDRQTTPMEATA